MITYSHIIDRIITSENLEQKEVFSKSREQKLVECRHIIWAITRKITLLSSKEIGRPFNCDHATVLHGIRKIKELSENEKGLADKLQSYSTFFENFDPEIDRARHYNVGRLFWMRKNLSKKVRISK